MAILKDYSSQPNYEIELNLTFINDQSVRFSIHFRAARFPEVHTEITCLKVDFLKILDYLKQIDLTHLSMLEPLDPGLCIYHIPQYGKYHHPEYGIFQIPEQERNESEPLYKLIFVLDSAGKKNYGPSECGPALCLLVKMEQIHEFVDSLKSEINSF